MPKRSWVGMEQKRQELQVQNALAGVADWRSCDQSRVARVCTQATSISETVLL